MLFSPTLFCSLAPHHCTIKQRIVLQSKAHILRASTPVGLQQGQRAE